MRLRRCGMNLGRQRDGSMSASRMVNEYVYCPRLFFHEWVKGIFRESADTLEGSVQHRRVDKEGGICLPPMPDDWKTQAITLSSDRFRVVAKMDIVQSAG